MTELSIADLKILHDAVNRWLGNSNSLEVPVLVALRDRLTRMVAERAGQRAWGSVVFRLVLPFYKIGTPYVALRGKNAGKTVTPAKMDLAPRLNVYGSLAPWQRVKLYRELDVRIMAEMGKWPDCRLAGRPRPRAVRVTRYSSVMPDEITVDVIGGKVPVDRLVHAGILMGDSAQQLVRDARWVRASPGAGQLLVEVHELD